MSPDELVQRNVLVWPIGAVEERARELSALLAQLGTEFVLGPNAIPHLSIYTGGVPAAQ